ncbi:MAG: PatB family C-S lyase [Victivallales bacterium]|nr:PatB family C-S lyase [Victivallales bacterium]MCF7888813.1 PatB family C-S lyase [Victivallales bacterium]
MKHYFDKFIPRRRTNCFKWDFSKYRKVDMLPMWVADMDFRSPPEVIEALHKRVDHGVFGYTFPSEELEDIIIRRLKKLYSWNIKKEWLVWLPGLVTGFNIACRAAGNINDDVATFVPIYYPFLKAPANNIQTLTEIPLVEKNKRWTIDFEGFDKAVKENTKLFLFCNPHNPGGTMFTEEELLKFAEICKRHDLVICSDEIHCDLILSKNKKHIPLASLSPEISERTITLMAPSKTFNIAGLGCSFAIISDEKLRIKYKKAKEGLVPHVNLLGYTAALAAYKHGDEWLEKLLEYLRGNYRVIKEFVARTPGLNISEQDATYLAWIDACGLGLEKPAEYFEKYNVGMSEGAVFRGPGYIRMNFGCSRSILNEALKRIKAGIDDLT